MTFEKEGRVFARVGSGGLIVSFFVLFDGPMVLKNLVFTVGFPMRFIPKSGRMI